MNFFREYGGLILIFALVISCVGVFIWAFTPSDATRHATYSAWVKLYKREDITFEEWKHLNNADLLPGQASDRGANLATGLMLGTVIGGAAKR